MAKSKGKGVMTEYPAWLPVENVEVYPECPYADALNSPSKEVYCTHKKADKEYTLPNDKIYCSSLCGRGACPFKE